MRNTEQTILFGKYRILCLLGQGAGGQVYLVEHMKLKTNRAIKRISKSHPLQSQFRLEANLLENLSHPSIPTVFDTEEDDEYFYIIEEYVQGNSLQEYLLCHDNISQEYIMQLGIRLCDVFIYLHGRKPFPIVYRDLKPEHIIVYGNSVKIVDFGIASYITSQGKDFRQYGTIGYAAPEQYEGGMISPSLDLYALGKILEKMSKKLPGCSWRLARIIRKATQENAQKRYVSAMEFKNALETAFERLAKSSEKSRLPYQIAVAGAKPGIGSTHIAVALTTYLNAAGNDSVFRSVSGADVVKLLLRGRHVKEGRNEIFENGCFRGVIKTREQEDGGIGQQTEGTCVLDFGADLDGCAAEDADCTILVIGGSLWETECASASFQKLKHTKNLIVICNYSHRQICKKYAVLFDKKVYCFPFDKNPFVVTGKKRRLFEKMLHERR